MSRHPGDPGGRAPTLGVVVPCLEAAATIEETLASLDRAIAGTRAVAAGRFRVEVLVADGGSTDGTLPIVERFARASGWRWTSARDAGQAEAIARGFASLDTDWLYWLNADDLLDPEGLVRFFEGVGRHSEARWVIGPVGIVDGSGRPIRPFVTWYKGLWLRHFSPVGLVLQNFISQMGSFFQRALYEQVGGLDPSLHYTMDYDLWLRFSRVTRPLILEEPVASFRLAPGTKSAEGYPAQFAEDLEVARRRVPDRPVLLLVKSVLSWLIVGVYRMQGFRERARAGRGAR